MKDTAQTSPHGNKDFGGFARYLTLWVALCIVAGVAIGQLWPEVPNTLSRFTYAQVSIPVAILIWLMIYPMMVQIDFSSIVRAGRQPKGLLITLAACASKPHRKDRLGH